MTSVAKLCESGKEENKEFRMKKMKILTIIFCFALPAALSAQVTGHGQLNYDKKLAGQYGLVIPEPSDSLEPAPEWFRELDMIFSDWRVGADMLNAPYKLWKGYHIELKDTLVERIVRLAPLYGKVKLNEQKAVTIDGNFDGSAVKGVKLLSHVPHSKPGFEQAHKQGYKVIPYVHFTDIHTYYTDQDVFYFHHPEILLRDEKGRWVHLPMDGTDRLFRFLVCANSPSYWKLSLAYVKKLMDWGADGVFIDNVGPRKPCHAPEFTKLNPEFGPYVHEHLFPEASHDEAFDRFLQAIRKLVKSYGDDKVVILNSGIGTAFQKNGDCCMMESFIYSWAWEGRNPRQSWTNIKKRVKENEWFVQAGRRLTALSYLDPGRKEVKEDAFWAFGAARLLGVIWWANLENTGAEILYRSHMGKSLEPLQQTEKVAYKVFENGIIILNDGAEDKTVTVDLPPEFQRKALLDVYDGEKQVKVARRRLKIHVPAQKARVYLVMK